MKRMISLSGLLAAGLLLAVSASVSAAGGVYYDAQGRPFVVSQHGGKQTRHYCQKALYGELKCPQVRWQPQFGPHSRDFAFSQGHQIQR